MSKQQQITVRASRKVHSGRAGWGASAFGRYAPAILAPLVAAVLAWAFRGQLDSYPTSPFVLAVLMAALLGGFGPGLLTTLLSAGFLVHEFTAPFGQFKLLQGDALLLLVLFLFTGVATTLVAHRLRITRQRLVAEAAEFRAVVENAAIGIARVSFADERWIDVNDTFSRMLGYSRSEILQRSWPSVTHPDDIDRDLVPFRQMEAGALDSYVVEKRFLHRDGHAVWARLTLSLVRDADGAPAYEIAVIEDISSQRQAADTLAERAHEREGMLTVERVARERTERLQSLTAALSASITMRDVVRVVIDAGLDALGADAGLVALIDPDDGSLRLAEARGYQTEVPSAWERIAPDAQVPVAEAVRESRTLVLLREERRRRFPSVTHVLDRYEATLAIPLKAHGRVVGALAVNRAQAGDLSAEAVAFMDAFAQQCAHAIERARLHETAVEARRAAEQTEAQLLAVLDRLPAAVWIADAVGRIERVSAATSQLYGDAPMSASAAEYVAYEAYWPAGHPRAGRRLESGEWALARSLTTGETVLNEALEIVQFGTGQRRQVLNSSAAIRDPQGTITGGVAVMFDATEQEVTRVALERARAEADAERQRLRLVLDRLPVGVIVVDATGAIMHHNPALELVLGHSPHPADGVKGYAVYGGLHDDGRSYAPEEYPVARAVLHGEIVLRELTRYRRADGSVVTLSISAAPVFGDAGDLAFAVAAVEDVHERESARAAAEQANAAKSHFLATMSHELRTPLHAIAGHVQLVELGIHGPVTPGQIDALNRVQRAQKHLLSLINDILNFARLDAGRMEYHIEQVLLGDVVGDVLPMVEPMFASREIALTVDLGPEQPVQAWADREKLGQVLLNLLSNAAKFTEPGGSTHVSVHGPHRDRVHLRVTDSGVGIPATKLEQIFEAFVQVDRGLTSRHEGTGLGLSISRTLARGMGGEISVASELGAGSTFTVELRATRTDDGRAIDRRSRYETVPQDASRRADDEDGE
jgi:PAS domain S-box-containing protein